MWRKRFLLAGLFFAMTAVALGAFGAHGLKRVLAEAQLATFETAVRYQMYHALALVMLSISQRFFAEKKWRIGCLLIVVGTAVFSVSLYLYLASGITAIAMLTPLGGSALILGWLWLVVGAWQGNGNDVSGSAG